MDHVISEQCYIGKIIQSYRKNLMTIPFHGHFPISLKNSMVKELGRHVKAVL